MTHEQVQEMVEKMGLSCAYGHFAEGQSPEPPFLVFLYPESRNFAADGIAYFKRRKLHLELYTDYKSVELEERIEAGWKAMVSFMPGVRCGLNRNGCMRFCMKWRFEEWEIK